MTEGIEGTIPVFGLMPGETAYLGYGLTSGSGPCPPPLGGLCLDLVSPMRRPR